jgi:hypothetical protein
MKITLLILFSIFLFSPGCKTEGVIEEEKFVKVYADLLIAGDTASVDSAKSRVFNRYNISSGDYKTTVDYYNSNPGKWEPFFDKVIAHIEELKKDSSLMY